MGSLDTPDLIGANWEERLPLPILHGFQGHAIDQSVSLPPIMVTVIVVAMLVPRSIPIAAAITIPAMIMVEVSTRCRPVTLEVAAPFPIGFDPIRLRQRRAAPIAVMPRPAPVDGIPIAFHPLILRGGRRRNTIDPGGRRRRPEREAERYLRVSCRRR